MTDTGGIQSILYTLVTVIWVFVDLVVAGVVFYRFRATAAGIVVGGGHVLLSLKNVASLIVFSLVFRFVMPEIDVHFAMQFLFRIVSIFLYLFIGVGLLFIPRSLRKLSPAA